MASKHLAESPTTGVVERTTLRTAHASIATGELRPAMGRNEREAIQRAWLASGAAVGTPSGNREVDEEPDPWRTCFERDRDRIVHSTPFRRLAGKTQVFIFPADHQRTRLTHALEVAQVATAIARAARLNVALTEAIALGHDCGHGPVGHASEEAFSPFLPEGFQHAVWGADVALRELNLCAETLDGIRNHSWCRPAPATAEAEVVAWADRIAYLCHDFEDAVRAGITRHDELPAAVADTLGRHRSKQIDRLIRALVETITAHGVVAMPAPEADALAAWREFNYDRIYLRPDARSQAEQVIRLLRALVEHFARLPARVPLVTGVAPGSEDAVRAAVEHLAGMTDRYAFRTAIRELDWPTWDLPHGVEGRV